MLTACLAATAFARPTFNVRDYGAVGDNATDDTGAFEQAIAAAGGGGQLLVPAGGVFLIRPVNLSSSMEFFIEGGATVAGIADNTKWPIIQAAPSYGQGRDHPGPRYTCLLYNATGCWIDRPGVNAYLEQLRRSGPFNDILATINRSKHEPFCPAWCEAAHRGAWRSAPEPSGN